MADLDMAEEQIISCDGSLSIESSGQNHVLVSSQATPPQLD